MSTIPSKPLNELILIFAAAELGRAEDPKGSNWGTFIRRYLASVNITFPAPWCMAFVYWCVEQACNQKQVKNELLKTGGVMYQWGNVAAKLKHSKSPQAGDIFIMDFGKGKGHTGFVEKVKGDRIYTIEGNSVAATGTREGFEVCRREGGRSIASIKGFIRLS